MAFADFLNGLKEKAGDLVDMAKKAKSKKFMEATVAGCAMVAYADGTAAPEEKQKMINFMKQNAALKVYSMKDVLKAFEEFASGFELDYGIGVATALQAISKMADSEHKDLLIRVCCAVGASDGDFDKDEKVAVRKICHELRLNPGKYSL